MKKAFPKILIPLLFISVIAFWFYFKVKTTPEKIAWDTIARLLCDDDPEIRSEIALAIGRLEEVSPGDKRGILLLKKAFSDTDAKVRKCAVIAFSKIYTPESFSFLQKGLNDPDCGVRVCSAIPLLSFNSQSAFHTLRQALPDSQIGLSAAVALGRFGDPMALTILQDKLNGSDIIAKISAVEVLSATDDEFLSVIKQAMESPDEQARVHAIETVSNRKTDSFITILLEIAMKDNDPEIRQKAIEALVKFKTQNSKLKTQIVPLLKRTFTDKSDIVRVGVCKALGQIRNLPHQNKFGAGQAPSEIRNSIISLLEQALQDSSNFVRIEAAESLIKLGKKRGFYVLNSALKIGDKWEKRCAAKALARVGIPASIKILQMSLTEKDKKNRIYIAEAIIKISKKFDRGD